MGLLFEIGLIPQSGDTLKNPYSRKNPKTQSLIFIRALGNWYLHWQQFSDCCFWSVRPSVCSPLGFEQLANRKLKSCFRYLRKVFYSTVIVVRQRWWWWRWGCCCTMTIRMLFHNSYATTSDYRYIEIGEGDNGNR